MVTTLALQTDKDRALRFAIEFLRPYIERGDTLEWISSTHMGYYGDKGHAQVGSWFEGKKLRPNQVGVELPAGDKFVFRLEDLARAIKDKGAQLSLL
ncbi:MAG: hypothetical protein MUP81_06070 [Dehalococcoidia bacterium]|nr:hypothetical protein [Dehalococcoidia bacterium]